ncbi:alkane 1-monooxygenase [Simiduia agarivorans]|uniref:Alkane 1-monooxygenase n=1 Tax=Simiduia agarivorans (strain DSM 21679 / JCM 13881 / BCRC 17597 / SA1) TaxID=1117647 RepID=K4KP06_SIMAS|nr:alkane 1-monooxygenase [Simiduia agarivorans]AFV00742.1 alkane 1-monooxygenase [Simiduia agarivorans SA1 = DSM 21679]
MSWLNPTFVAEDENGSTVSYRDGKRLAWAWSVINPFFAWIGIGLYALTDQLWWLWYPVLQGYVIFPLLDAWLGEDTNNPPEAVVPQLEQDPYYRWLTYLVVPMHYIVFVGAAWWVMQAALPWHGYLAVAIAAGLAAGLGINTGHELGHKNRGIDRWLAKLVLAVPFYGHFWIEHNRGHHRHVSTPEDVASSRMGETIYQFALREMPGAARRGWQLEADRLSRKGVSVWSWQNEILQSYAVSLLLQGGLVVWLGLGVLPFLLIHNFLAWWQLTSANYVEHYGLLREKRDNGRYEPCQPHHSWNSNHKLTNQVLFHLQRHSDHHANMMRSYQSLRDFPDLPRLPNGYYGMFLLAYVPSLWFKVMNPRLLALPHVQGDWKKINVLPAKRDALMRQYGNSL